MKNEILKNWDLCKKCKLPWEYHRIQEWLLMGKVINEKDDYEFPLMIVFCPERHKFVIKYKPDVKRSPGQKQEEELKPLTGGGGGVGSKRRGGC